MIRFVDVRHNATVQEEEETAVDGDNITGPTNNGTGCLSHLYTSLLLEQTMDVYDLSTPFII